MEIEYLGRIADILSDIETALNDISWQLRQMNEKRELTDAETEFMKKYITRNGR